jgi:hypothetical protein
MGLFQSRCLTRRDCVSSDCSRVAQIFQNCTTLIRLPCSANQLWRLSFNRLQHRCGSADDLLMLNCWSRIRTITMPSVLACSRFQHTAPLMRAKRPPELHIVVAAGSDIQHSENRYTRAPCFSHAIHPHAFCHRPHLPLPRPLLRCCIA